MAYASAYVIFWGDLHMLDERPVSLFRNGRNQAVRIPREFEMEGSQALMRKEGDSLVITPIKTNRLLAMLAEWEPLEEDFPEVDDLPMQERDIF
jgi:antitoxin VapB